MNALDETLGGTWEVMVGQNDQAGRGMERISASDASMRLSFFGVLLMVLLDLAAHSMNYSVRMAQENAPEIGRGAYVALSSLATFSSYLAFLFIVVLLCQLPQFSTRLNAVLVVNNWANAIVSALFLPVVFTYVLVGGDAWIWGMISIFVFGLVCFAGTRIMRDTLETGTSLAIGIFAGILVVSILVSSSIEALLGVAPA